MRKMPQRYPSTMTNNYQRLLLFCSICFFLCAKTQAQTDGVLSSLQKQFNDYQQQAAQEKLYLHLDKDFFTAGEIIWFKAYAVDAASNKPTHLSKVAYVEVLDADKKPSLQAKIKLVDGSGSGSFQLPASVHSGSYHIRAYTSWMKNFSADLYFHQNITIVNTLKSLNRNPGKDTDKYEIRFFPEGGNLVNGIESKVGFRVVDKYGKGMDCNGIVADQNGNNISSFKSLKFGIGSFIFTPMAANNYTAVVTIAGQTFKQPLPTAYTQGVVMHVQEAGSQVNIQIASSASTTNIYLLVTTGNGANMAFAKQLSNGKASFAVDKTQLADGITHFTVFNSDAQPVCERLYFTKPSRQLVIDAATGMDGYAGRQKVTVDIATKDEKSLPVPADMSMSVYRLDSLQQQSETSIASYLLLNADLRGTIEQPDYYLANNDAVNNEALDNLMLTHGWSRYNWDDIKQGKTVAFDYLPEYEGHIVTARITNKKTGQPAENITAYLTAPGKNFKFAVAKSKSNGIVQFNVVDFVGGDAIILQTNQLQDSIYRIDIVNPFSEKFSVAPLTERRIAEENQGLLVSHSINTQVQNAYYNEKYRQFFAPDVDTLPFYGHPTATYVLDDYTRFNTMEEVLREYVPEVAVRRHRDDYLLKVVDDSHNLYFEDNPLVLADGVPFFNMDTVINFNPLKIKKMDVVAKKYYLGANIFYGIVNYTTYNGDLDGIQLDPASLVLEYQGMQLQREFYAPKYDTPKQLSSRLPDFRDVLLWAPDVKTDERTGKTQASFYTSDVAGTYAIVLQGITPLGKVGTKTVYVMVK